MIRVVIGRKDKPDTTPPIQWVVSLAKKLDLDSSEILWAALEMAKEDILRGNRLGQILDTIHDYIDLEWVVHVDTYLAREIAAYKLVTVEMEDEDGTSVLIPLWKLLEGHTWNGWSPQVAVAMWLESLSLVHRASELRRLRPLACLIASKMTCPEIVMVCPVLPEQGDIARGYRATLEYDYSNESMPPTGTTRGLLWKVETSERGLHTSVPIGALQEDASNELIRKAATSAANTYDWLVVNELCKAAKYDGQYKIADYPSFVHRVAELSRTIHRECRFGGGNIVIVGRWWIKALCQWLGESYIHGKDESRELRYMFPLENKYRVYEAASLDDEQIVVLRGYRHTHTRCELPPVGFVLAIKHLVRGASYFDGCGADELMPLRGSYGYRTLDNSMCRRIVAKAPKFQDEDNQAGVPER